MAFQPFCGFGCAPFWWWVSLAVPFTNSLIEGCFIMMTATIIMSMLFILNDTFRLLETKIYCFCNYILSWMFLTPDIIFEYWIEHVTFGPFVMFKFSTRIFCSRVPGFTTNLPSVTKLIYFPMPNPNLCMLQCPKKGFISMFCSSVNQKKIEMVNSLILVILIKFGWSINKTNIFKWFVQLVVLVNVV